MDCMCLCVGNMEVRLDKIDEIIVSLDDFKCDTNVVPLFLNEKCTTPSSEIVELDEPIIVLITNDVEDNTIFGPNAAHVINQWLCQKDNLEVVDYENQVLEDQ